MNTPQNIFRYSSAATAGYAFALPIARWVGLMVTRLLNVTIICSVFSLICCGVWLRDGDQYSFNYAVGFAITAATSGLLLGMLYIIGRMIFRRP